VEKRAPHSPGAYYFSTIDSFGIYADNSLVKVVACACVYGKKRAKAMCEDGKKEVCWNWLGSSMAGPNCQPVGAVNIRCGTVSEFTCLSAQG
jgi:hypothetical protein